MTLKSLLCNMPVAVPDSHGSLPRTSIIWVPSTMVVLIAIGSARKPPLIIIWEATTNGSSPDVEKRNLFPAAYFSGVPTGELGCQPCFNATPGTIG